MNERMIRLNPLSGLSEGPPRFSGPRPTATVAAGPAPTTTATAAPPTLLAVGTASTPRPSTLVGTPNLVQALVKYVRRQIMHRCSRVLGEFAIDGWGSRLAREGQRGAVTIREGTNAT